MKWFCRNWYNFGLVIAIATIVYLAFNWSAFDWLSRIMWCNFIAILLHQYEEYGNPGGEPIVMNIILRESDIPDRYPLNQFSAMLVNVVITYGLYLPAALFQEAIWLGLASCLMSFGQIPVHAIMTPRKMHKAGLKRYYNPGLVATFVMAALSVCYIWIVCKGDLSSWIDWAIAVGVVIFVTGFLLKFMTYTLLANRQSKWAFDKEEMNRFKMNI